MSATRITGIYIPVQADLVQLRSDMGKVKQIVTESATAISNSLNNALDGGQISKGMNSLISNLGTLARSQALVKESFQATGVALGDLQKLTGTTGGEFIRLQQRMFETQAAKAQENALRSVATAIGATKGEIKDLGSQYGLSEAQIQRVTVALHGEEKAVQSLASRIKELNSIKPISNYTTLASSATSGLGSSANAGTAAFAKDLVALSNGADIARKSVDLLDVDMVALSKTTGLTDAHIVELKSRFANIAGENAQSEALRRIAVAAGLTQKEIAALGSQHGLSEAQIRRVTVAIYGEEKAVQSLASRIKELNSIKPISNYTTLASSATSGLNSSANAGTAAFAKDLVALSNGADIARKSVNLLDIDMKALSKTTGLSGERIGELKSRFATVAGEKAQADALKNIATNAGFTAAEVRVMGTEMGLSKKSIDQVAAGMDNVGKSTAFSVAKFRDMIITVGLYTVAFQGLSAVINGITSEFTRGLKAVEDYALSVAKITALNVTFSKKTSQGDLAGAYTEANQYAKDLIKTMDIIDQKSLLNSQELTQMYQSFIANGVQLNVNSQEQVAGFTAVAGALAILTQGQDRNKQITQEVRGLLDGQIGAADTLGQILKAQIPDIEKRLAAWKQEGTVLENLKPLLEGFLKITPLLEDQWATVGTTMESIHNKILKGMFEPIFKDLIGLAKQFNTAMQDSQGNLTPLAKGIQEDVVFAYETGKKMVKEYGNEVLTFTELVVGAKVAQYAFNVAVKANPYIAAATALIVLNDSLKTYNLNLDSLPKKYASMVQSISNVVDVMQGLRDPETGKIFTDLEQIDNQIQGLKDKSADTPWSLFPDPAEERRRQQEILGQLNDLYARREELTDGANERLREKNRGGSVLPVNVPQVKLPTDKPYQSRASDLNSAMQAEVELIKAKEEKKLAIIKAGFDSEKEANDNAYELGLSSHSAYLDAKNRLTQESLKATLDAREAELAAAKDAASKLSPITDKEGNARPDKDAKATADAYKRVEDAERAVITARDELTKAEVEGNQQSKLAARELSDTYKQINIQLLESQGKSVEAARMQAEYDEQSIERQRLIKAALEGSAEAQKILDAQRLMSAENIRKAELDQLSQQKEAIVALAEMDGQYQKSLQTQIELLDVEIERAKLAGELPEKVALLQREREELEKMKDPLSAFAKGWQDAVGHQQTSSELMHTMATETAQGMQSSFQTFFADGLKGQFSSVGEAFQSLCDSMVNAFINSVAQMAAQQLTSSLFGSSTSSTNSGSGDSDSGWVNTAWTAISDWWGESDWATGGYMDQNPGGGVINAGSGFRDDVFLKMTGPVANYGMGGEFIMPKGPTAKYLPVLENMRRENFADGGVVGGSGQSSRVFERFEELVVAMQAAGVQTTAISPGFFTLAEAIKESDEAARGRTESAYAEVAAISSYTAVSTAKVESIKQQTKATEQTTSKSFDLSDSLVDLGVSFADTVTDVAAMALGLGPLGPKAKDAILGFTGIGTALDSMVSTVKDNINDFQESIGFAGETAQTTASSIDGASSSLGDFADSVDMAGSMATEAAYGSNALGTEFGNVSSQSGIAASSVGSFSASLGDMANSAISAASAISEAAASVSASAAEARGNAGGMLGDPDIDSSDRYDNSTPGGILGNGNSGSGSSSDNGTTGSVGPDGGGYNGESDNESGWAKGGIVNKLFVPNGDDGFGALKLGEGVIDVDTMKILSASIRTGKFAKDNARTESATVIHNHFYVDGKEIASSIMPAIDKHVSSKASRGALSQRTVF